ncbi:hypothetical protein JL100_014845 [Skermanella mucosa]|uniref:hypothetical protein n=1 Tax=Skermanella mucosa TaxID=1789672 RepID=UPI00192AA5CE|nr:hypothetical protein [Skermanella mucosa]UEM18408.1 hypothetical protein JL100_014845 [Skermanella mucosa]
MDGSPHLKHHDIREIGKPFSPYGHASYFAWAHLPARTCTGAASLIGGGQIGTDCIARLRS